MHKILFVIGTRPEAIKMAPLVKKLQKIPKFCIEVCVTAQHREMLDQVMRLFEISPDYDLNIMKNGQDLYDITSGVLVGMRDVLKTSSPDLVLVHGDTTTTFSTALAAFYQQIQIGHIEAGLRTGDLKSPWPEEANRSMTTRMTNFHFAPTENSSNNLLLENIKAINIYITGNTVTDALLWVLKKLEADSELCKEVICTIQKSGYPLPANHGYLSKKIILVTGHRRENFGQGFLDICEALKRLAKKYPEVDIVYPVHLNPNVQKPVRTLLNNLPNVFLITPLDYTPFVYLMKQSYLILTDSGGIQEEAPTIGKPVLVMRNTTERPEALAAGTVKLVGTDKEKIILETSLLLDNPHLYEEMSHSHNPYGDGTACDKIIEVLMSKLITN